MDKPHGRSKKLAISVFAGLLVTLVSMMLDGAADGFGIISRTDAWHYAIGDFIPGLLTTIICLVIQLRQEEMHYRAAIDRAAIISELNHHIRNAVFPLFLMAQKTQDESSRKVASDALDRINAALKEATVDALSGRVDYSNNGK